MARIVGFSPSQMSGSVGNYTYRQTKNGTIVSEKIQKQSNPKRTFRQMLRRMTLTSLSSLYKAFHGALSQGFENMPKGWNAMNAFISANSQRSRVYLTKDMVQNGVSVVDSYQITRGSLRTIEVERSGRTFRTDLSLGGLVITEQTTIGELSKVLHDNNLELHYGDRIAYFAIRQTRDFYGYLRAVVNRWEIRLDAHSGERVWDIGGREGFCSNGGYLGQAAEGTLRAGGFAWVQLREVDDNMMVSTQFIQSVNDEVVAEMSTAEAMECAIASYGGLTEATFFQPQLPEWKMDGYNLPCKDISLETATSTPSADTADTTKADTSAGGPRTLDRIVTYSLSPSNDCLYIQQSGSRMPPAILREIINALSSPTGRGSGGGGMPAE